jgi:hypothetical protein
MLKSFFFVELISFFNKNFFFFKCIFLFLIDEVCKNYNGYHKKRKLKN